jgi:iron complex transport system substrate-binding protein
MPVFRFRPIAGVLCIVVAACHARNGASSAAATPLDDFGDAVAIARPPRRIVSLNPTTTEILFAIGAGSRLVGRSDYDVFPEAARAVPSVGVALRPNVEAVLATHPDLVILYPSADNRTAYDRLRSANVAVVAFKIDAIEQFLRDTRVLGRITGDSARAALTADTVEATLARVRAATAALPKPTVFLHTWDKPIISIGGGSFLSELLDIAGARNIYAAAPTPSVTVALEDVVRRNPDFVLATPTSAPKIRTNELWRAIPAVRAGHVLEYDTALVSRPSTMLGAAARSLANLIHPGSVP